MAIYFENDKKNGFTKINENDKIKKTNKFASGIGGREYLLESAKRVRQANRYASVNPVSNPAAKAQSSATPKYNNYGVAGLQKPFKSKIEKLEQERVARAAGVTRFSDVEPKKAESIMKLKEKRPDDYYHYQGNQKEESKRIDEVFGAKTDFSISNFENNYKMMNKEEQEMLTHKMQVSLNHFGYRDKEGMRLKTDGKLGPKTSYAYGNYKRDEDNKALFPEMSDSMKEDSSSYAGNLRFDDGGNRPEGEKHTGRQNAYTQTAVLGGDSARFENISKSRSAYNNVVGYRDKSLFEERIYNNIVRENGDRYNNIKTNYKKFKENGLVYAIARLIELKKEYGNTTDPHAKAIYAASGKYLKLVIKKIIGSDKSDNAIKEALRKEALYDGSSIENWVKAFDCALDNKMIAGGYNIGKNLSPLDVDVDLYRIASEMYRRTEKDFDKPIVLTGGKHLTENKLYVRYNSGSGLLDNEVLSNKYNLFDDIPGGEITERLNLI